MTTMQDFRSLRIKANKTSLYRLVSEYATLPPMGQTRYNKAHRCRSYWLRWGEYSAYLSTVGGGVLLSIDGGKRKVYTITVEDLRQRGMIEEATK